MQDPAHLARFLELLIGTAGMCLPLYSRVNDARGRFCSSVQHSAVLLERWWAPRVSQNFVQAAVPACDAQLNCGAGRPAWRLCCTSNCLPARAVLPVIVFEHAGFEEQLEALGQEVAAQAAAYDETDEGIAE